MQVCTKNIIMQRGYLVLNWYFLSFVSSGNANRLQCSINVNYQSLAGVELVVLQDKLLLPMTRTTLHSMTSENGKIVVDFSFRSFKLNI